MTTATKTVALPAITVCAADVGAAIGWSPYNTPKSVLEKLVAAKFPDAAAATTSATDTVETKLNEAAAAVSAPAAAALAKELGLADHARAVDAALALQKKANAAAAPAAVTAAAAAAVSSASAAAAKAAAQALAAPAAATTDAKQLQTKTASVAAVVARAVTANGGSTAVSDALVSAARSCAYTARGRRDEADGLQLYADAARVPVVKGNVRLRRRVVIPGKVTVVGMEDGMHADGSCIVEVKRRQSNFFRAVPNRELAQMYMYMHLVDARRAAWVQLLDGHIQYKIIEWDEKVWDSIVAGLAAFHEAAAPYLVDVHTAAGVPGVAPDLRKPMCTEVSKGKRKQR